LRRAGFLLTSVIVAAQEGLPTLGFTPAAQAFDQAAAHSFFNELKAAFRDEIEDDSLWTTALRKAASPSQWREWQESVLSDPAFEEHRLGDTLERMREYVARISLVYADSFGAAVDMVRQLDFDDRPRGALTPDDTALLVRDNRLIRHLLAFATSEECLKVRTDLVS